MESSKAQRFRNREAVLMDLVVDEMAGEIRMTF